MKRILLYILAILVLIGVTVPMIGGSMAGFCDSETSYDNYIETGDVDLKVAKCDDNWENCGNLSDDLPWGSGLETCFDISVGELCQSYDCNLLVWNAGCVDGMVYVHVSIVEDEKGLASKIDMDIWYDDDGNGKIDNGKIKEDRKVSERISDLACNQIELGSLPAGAERKLKVDIHAHSGSLGDSLTFNIQFDLVSDYFSDSEISQGNYFEVG